jgi:hypothetical protein
MPTGGGGGGGGGGNIVHTRLVGTGSGAYTTTSASFVVVDATNLSVALVTFSSKIIILWASGDVSNLTTSQYSNVGLGKDGTVVAQVGMSGTSSGAPFPFNICYSEIGDGLSHTWALYFNATGGTTSFNNTSGGRTPFINILQIPGT